MTIILTSVLAGAAVAALVLIVPATLAVVVMLSNSTMEGKSHEKEL